MVSRRSLLAAAPALVAAVPLGVGRSSAAKGVAGQPNADAVTGVEVASSKVDITPDSGTFMAGYGVDVPRAATGTRAPLYARCVVLWHQAVPRVIVTADVLGFGRMMHRAIRARVTTLGVAPADFVLTATHTHNGPVLSEKLDPYITYGMRADHLAGVEAYSDSLVDAIVGLVRDTLAAQPRAGTIDYRVTRQSFSVNRERLPYVERDVPVLVVRAPSGDPLVVLFSYGCHPTAAGIQVSFDPDYPGVAAARVEAATGAFAQFLLGPAGDQNPTAPWNWANSDRLGGLLGDAVIEAVATPGRPLDGQITSQYQEISLPLDINHSPGNLAAVRAAYASRRTAAGLFGYYRRHAEVMIRQLDQGTFDSFVPLPLQVWSFSGAPRLRLALTGGEIVSGYGAYFRNRYGGSDGLLFAGYANEVPAYIPSDELLRRSDTYAGGISPDHPGIAGGSMTIYGCLGHFRGRPTSQSPAGVEQIVINALQAMLG